jgi:type II secretory pathway pseudopilin PulG
MNTTMEHLAGAMTVLAMLALLTLPSLLGLAHERRVDRQIREAEQARAQTAPEVVPPSPRSRQAAVTTTVTAHC